MATTEQRGSLPPRTDIAFHRESWRKAMSPSALRDALLVGLTVSSGAVDAISFLALGHVFTAFMTGNLVFLGFGLAGAGDQDVLRVAVALAAFGAGVFVAVKIVKPTRGSAVWPHRVTIALGIAVLAQVAFLLGWVASSGRPSTAAGDVLVGLSALAMGLQSGAVMSLGVEGVFTTAATATLIKLASDLAGWSTSASERRRFAAVLAGLIAGAAGGGLLLAHARTFAPVLPLVIATFVVATAALSRKRMM